MSLSHLARVIAAPEFLHEVSGMIMEKVVGLECVAAAADGPLPGRVVDYELIGSMQFADPDGEGAKFNIPFRSAGIASGTSGTPGGEERTFSRDGEVRGLIRVELGPEALKEEPSEEILDGTIIEIDLSHVDVDEKPEDTASPEKFAGES